MRLPIRLALPALLVFIPMLVEAARAARNERLQFARGGIEPPGDVFAIMRIVYPGGFLAMIVEGWLRGAPRGQWLAAGLISFAAAKILKWWAILALGPCWTFRVVVVPGAGLVRRGPYRFLRHPNYVAVVLELIGAAAMTGAVVSGPLTVVLFSALLRQRIAVENRALDAASRHPPCSL
jgi:methyltransferase